MSRINISICVLPPPSLTVMWYWKSFYLFLIFTVREATLLHQSDLCITSSQFSVSTFYFLHFQVLRSSCVVTCHLVTTQKRKLGKFSDCQPGNWTSPVSVSSVSLTLVMSLMVLVCLFFYRGLSHLTVLTSEMSDVTLGNSQVIKIIFYGPLEALDVYELIRSHTFISGQTGDNYTFGVWVHLILPKPQ